MQINTTRFGEVSIEENDVISFPEGLLGFSELKKFVLLDDPDDDIFAWLQSCENASVAFPVLEPELFAGDYKVKLGKRDMSSLNINSMDRVRIYSIVTIPEDPTQMTANLKAPIVINIPNRVASQCVLQDNDLPIRQPIFTKLQQRFVQPTASPFTSLEKDVELAVKITPSTKGMVKEL
ncbi:MAG: flagellar assembly protein FliW [Bdellovibrionales bacterium]